MSTAFAPSQPHPHPNAEGGDEQPHHEFPPPSHVQGGAFAHQLKASTAAYASSPPPNTQRPTGTLRQHSSNGGMASANGNGNGQPMAVPGGRTNGHGGHGHGGNLREMGFAGPRSPPNNKSRLLPTPSARTARGR
jgi:hypothetical protein